MCCVCVLVCLCVHVHVCACLCVHACVYVYIITRRKENMKKLRAKFVIILIQVKIWRPKGRLWRKNIPS